MHEENLWLTNLHKKIIKSGLETLVFMYETPDEELAFVLECALILQYGRRDLGTGILINRTDGGEGRSGRTLSAESRKKISDARLGLKLTPEHKKKVSDSLLGNKRALGYKHTEETRKILSQKSKGRIWTAEMRRKVSETHKKLQEKKRNNHVACDQR
jgi:hypothetical protein